MKQTNMAVSLKAQVIAAVDEMYIIGLRNKYTSYLKVSVRDILDHLLERYENITAADLHRNVLKLQEPVDTALPLDHYFKRIDDCVKYAIDGNDPFPSKTIINTDYHALHSKGLYKLTCKECKALQNNQQDKETLEKMFISEYKDLREEERTQNKTNYHAANNIQETPGYGNEEIG